MSWKTLSNNKTLKFVLFLIILVVCWYLGRLFEIDISTSQNLFSKYPLALSGFIFVLVYVGTTTFIWFGPKDVLRISSAIFFGPMVSTIFVWIGEMVNALVMFHLSRILGREYIQQKFHFKSQELDKVKNDSSYLAVMAWRINPLIPFRLLDLGYGLAQISFRKYFLAIVVISFFRILWLQFILAGIGANLFKDASAMVGYLSKNPLAVQYSAVYFLAVVVITVIAVGARYLRKKR